MTEAICDTGPILHLHEISYLKSLGSCDTLRLPNLVAEELRAHSLDLPLLASSGLQVIVTHLPETEWGHFLKEPEQPVIHAADAQVLALAQADRFRTMVLTDDLALRRRLEKRGSLVTGSIGVLVRSHTLGRISFDELTHAVEALFTSSSLHLSRGFREYVLQLIADLR